MKKNTKTSTSILFNIHLLKYRIQQFCHNIYMGTFVAKCNVTLILLHICSMISFAGFLEECLPCLVIFCYHYHQNYHHNYHWTVIIIISISLSYAENIVFDVRKKMYKLPEMGGGGGGGNLGNA